MIQLSQILSATSSGADIDEEEVRRIVREEIETDKISLSDLDEKPLKVFLKAQPTKCYFKYKAGCY